MQPLVERYTACQRNVISAKFGDENVGAMAMLHVVMLYRMATLIHVSDQLDYGEPELKHSDKSGVQMR